MSNIEDFLLIFILQLLFQLFRTLSSRVAVAKHITYTIITTIILQILWLVTTYLGVISMMTMNYYMIVVYMFGGIVGTYLSFKVLRHI